MEGLHPTVHQRREGWGTRFVWLGERTRTTAVMPTEFSPKDHSVWSKPLVEEFSIKIYHPHLLIIILQQRPANYGVGGAMVVGITLN
jgi:hypothetical protein